MDNGSTQTDSEKAAREEETYGGYDRLAQLMGFATDSAIFRRFANLSVESLLHYQAELCDLELKLKEIREADRSAGEDDERSTYVHNSTNLREASDSSGEAGPPGHNGQSSAQWDTMQKIRYLLQEYYSALALHQQIVNFNKPKEGHIKTLNEYMDRVSRGNILLTGDDSELWKETSRHDLLVMETATQDGTTSSRSTISLVRLYHQLIGRHVHKEETSNADFLRNTVVYHDTGVIKVIRMGKALAASMLPVVSIVILYFIKHMGARLGAVAALTAVFSQLMSYFTSASIKDVFASTAAFSAVLVVFIGTTDH